MKLSNCPHVHLFNVVHELLPLFQGLAREFEDLERTLDAEVEQLEVTVNNPEF